MTNEEAIGILEDVRDAICDNIPGNHAELDELREAVRMATEALRERKKGKWIKKDCDLLYCSECDLPSLHPWPYCERCGAKMEE